VEYNRLVKLEKLIEETEHIEAPLHYNNDEASAWEIGYQSFRELVKEVLAGKTPNLDFRY